MHRSSDEEVTKQDEGEVTLKPSTRMCIWKSKRCYYRNCIVTDLLLQLERIKEGSKVAEICQVQLTTDAKSKSKLTKQVAPQYLYLWIVRKLMHMKHMYTDC